MHRGVNSSDARGVGRWRDSLLHKMPIVVDSSQEFRTAITPLMEPPLLLHGGRSRKRWKLDALAKGTVPFATLRFVSSSSPLIRESTRFIYRLDLRSFERRFTVVYYAREIIEIWKNGANGEFSPISKKIRGTFDYFCGMEKIL